MPALASAADWAPTANVQYEWARFDDEARSFDPFHGFRRGRLGFRVRDEQGGWQFVAEHDFADKSPSDVYLEITPAEGHALRVGQFKQPFLLEDAVSDKNSALLEQSLLGAFAISRRIGVEYARFGDRGTVNAAIFGKRIDGRNESTGATMRATWRPAWSDRANYHHLGFSLASESPRTGRGSFAASPGTTFVPVRAASTGGIPAERLDRAAVEALWIGGAWMVQAEVGGVAARGDGDRFEGHAQSLLATWSPTHDARSQKRGVPGAPASDNAWELALRLSEINLDDGSVAGGRARQVGLGATWYPNRNARVIANVVHNDIDRDGDSEALATAGLRVQLTY